MSFITGRRRSARPKTPLDASSPSQTQSQSGAAAFVATNEYDPSYPPPLPPIPDANASAYATPSTSPMRKRLSSLSFLTSTSRSSMSGGDSGSKKTNKTKDKDKVKKSKSKAKKDKSKRGQAQENIAPRFDGGFYARGGSASPSPEPSLDIRLPAGLGMWRSSVSLGEHAGESGGLKGDGDAKDYYGAVVGGVWKVYEPRRRESVSSPDLRRTLDTSGVKGGELDSGLEVDKNAFVARWKACGGLVTPSGTESVSSRAGSTVDVDIHLSAPKTPAKSSIKAEVVPPAPPPPPPITRVPPEVVALIASHAERPDLLSLTRVSRAVSSAALDALYARVDLATLSFARGEKCIGTLAKNRDAAGRVRYFACASLCCTLGSFMKRTESLSVDQS